jgi:hypothetical protein
MPDSPVRQAISEWHNQLISGTTLMRRLVSYDSWMLPVSEAAAAEMASTGAASRLMYSQHPAGVSRLYLFSDGDAFSTYQKVVGEESAGQHFLTTAGAWVFQLPLDPLDTIEIDPATSWQISYRREQFTRLRSMAHAIDVEQALAALRAGTAEPGSVAKVRGYEQFSLAVYYLDGKHSLALAPDDRERALAAVFTADDAFDAFLPDDGMPSEHGQLLRVTLPGAKLFEQLSTMSIDGVVFNCSGPTKPVAFAKAFLEVVLDASRVTG